MAHSLSAKKRVRQNLKARARNRSRKDLIKDQTKAFTGALGKGDAAAADLEFKKLSQRLDRVASKNTIHKNAAARKKSRLAKRLNALTAKAGAGK